MKRRIWIMLLATLVLAASGCLGYKTVLGSGRVGEETREVSDFSEVVLSGLGGIEIRDVLDVPKLSIRISGGGSVRYIGDPSVSENVTGLGRVEQIRE